MQMMIDATAYVARHAQTNSRNFSHLVWVA
jgi:hypothetical protein